MLMKILNSNWVAYPAVFVSASCVGLLFLKGKTLAASICGSVLIVSILLILWGNRSEKSSRKTRQD